MARNSSKNSSLSEDLTVIFLRGNGSPRSYRLPLRLLQRSLTSLGLLVVVPLAIALFALLLNLIHLGDHDSAPVSVTALAPAAPPMKAPVSADAADEKDKELQGLHDDIAKLQAKIDGRTELGSGEGKALLQFLSPRSTLLAEGSSPMQVQNAKVIPDSQTKSIYVDFELHNTDPSQRQIRGYIVVLAKTAGSLISYPENAFSPTENIVVDFTKGETFAVSRFRQARATFSAANLTGKNPHFQVLLFDNDGRVITTLHVGGAG